MKVKITRIDATLPLPEYQTDGAAGFDMYAREARTIEPKAIVLVPTNLIVQTPPGYFLLVALRSSTPKKFGLLAPHGLGVIDSDYSGEKDEIWVQVYNFRDEPVTLERGLRFAQGIFVPLARAAWQEVANTGTTRGGGGSTGH